MYICTVPFYFRLTKIFIHVHNTPPWIKNNITTRNKHARAHYNVMNIPVYPCHRKRNLIVDRDYRYTLVAANAKRFATSYVPTLLITSEIRPSHCVREFTVPTIAREMIAVYYITI